MRPFFAILFLPAIVLAQVTANIPVSPARLTPFYISSRKASVRDKLSAPAALAVGHSGNVYVFDDGNSRIVRLDKNGNFLGEFGQPGSGAGAVQPGGLSDAIALDRHDNVFVVDPVSPKVIIFNSEGTFIRSFRVPFAVDSIAVNSAGEIFLSINSARPVALVYVFNSEGKFLRTVGDRLIKTPGMLPRVLNQTAIAIDAQDNLFVAFRSWPVVRKYSKSGELLAESSYKIPAGLLKEDAAKNYSLDFISQHPNSSYTLPLLAHCVSVNRAGEAYVLLNGHGLVRVGRSGQVVKQSRFSAGTARALFIKIAGGLTSDWFYLLDIESSSIQKLERI